MRAKDRERGYSPPSHRGGGGRGGGDDDDYDRRRRDRSYSRSPVRYIEHLYLSLSPLDLVK